MKHRTLRATISAYLGAALISGGFYPGLDTWLASIPILHAVWHVAVFIGGALLIYGLETLRLYARRYRRMTM